MSSARHKLKPAIVADQLHSAAIHLLRRLRKSDVATGLSPARLSVMSVLVFAGDKTLTQLAEAEQVSPPTMTKLVQALESGGLVRRSAVDEDKRSIHLTATPKGRRALLAAKQLRVKELTNLIASLSQDDLRCVAKSVELIQDLLSTA
jgi:DNA-binding MarR family transcriptional regulator